MPWWSTAFDAGEAEAAAQAVRDRRLSQGPLVRDFERELAHYLNVPHVVAVSSGSSALLLSLLATGIGRGDEVIVPKRSWIATAHAVVLSGATPVFVETQKDMPLMDLSRLAEKVTSRTRAILPVHVNGRANDMDSLNEFARQRGLIVIEDAAQALGSHDSSGRPLGTLSAAGCFSLSVAKIISTGQGGFVATSDDEVAQRLRNQRTHGVEDTIEPDSWSSLGFNFRFTDVLASIGLVQLRALPDRVRRVREIYSMYEEGLAECDRVRLIPLQPWETGPYVEVLAEDRSALKMYLQMRGIETRLFYPDQDLASYLPGAEEQGFSRDLWRHGLYLPSGPSQSSEALAYVIEQVQQFDRKPV